MCDKTNIPNELHQRLHLRNRHKMAAQLLIEKAEREDKEATRAQQQAMIDALLASVEQRAASAAAPAEATCESCGQTFTGQSEGVAQNALRLHTRAKHKE